MKRHSCSGRDAPTPQLTWQGARRQTQGRLTDLCSSLEPESSSPAAPPPLSVCERPSPRPHPSPLAMGEPVPRYASVCARQLGSACKWQQSNEQFLATTQDAITQDAITQDAITHDAITQDAITQDAITQAHEGVLDYMPWWRTGRMNQRVPFYIDTSLTIGFGYTGLPQGVQTASSVNQSNGIYIA